MCIYLKILLLLKIKQVSQVFGEEGDAVSIKLIPLTGFSPSVTKAQTVFTQIK